MTFVTLIGEQDWLFFHTIKINYDKHNGNDEDDYDIYREEMVIITSGMSILRMDNIKKRLLIIDR